MEFALAILVLALALAVLAYPLYRVRTQPLTAAGSALDDLYAERDGVYATLRDLDLDRQLGKLDQADYAALRDKYMTRATEILQQIDWLHGEGAATSASTGLEQEIAALRAHKPEDRLPAGDGQITAVPQPGQTVRCPNCGRPCPPGDKYCARCGYALK
jgi:hypothetical protein